MLAQRNALGMGARAADSTHEKDAHPPRLTGSEGELAILAVADSDALDEAVGARGPVLVLTQ
jgi:hypothetical protein